MKVTYTGGGDKKKKKKKGKGLKRNSPGAKSVRSTQEFAHSREKPKGGGGGVPRRAADMLNPANKKQIRKSKRTNKAKGRKAPKTRY